MRPERTKGMMTDMENYQIGTVCRICNVTHRTLRYYEEIGLIEPDEKDTDSGYRYYSTTTIRKIQMIRYMVDYGFDLTTIKQLLLTENIETLKKAFQHQINRHEEKIRQYKRYCYRLESWLELLKEGALVAHQAKLYPQVKFFPEDRYFYYERDVLAGEKNMEAAIEMEYFNRYAQKGRNAVDIGQPFIFIYDSLENRLAKNKNHLTLLQGFYEDSRRETECKTFGGFHAVCGHHKGFLDSVNDTYEALLEWAEKHNFAPRGNCVERPVIDEYTVSNEENHIRQIIIPVEERDL